MTDHQYDPYEEPLAGELVERHRNIHSSSVTPPTPKRPPLTVGFFFKAFSHYQKTFKANVKMQIFANR